MYSFFRFYFPSLYRMLFRMSSLCAIFAFTVSVKGQDPQLALFQYHSLFLNPAYTGAIDGDWRFSAGYRNQNVVTAQPYKTAIASFDGHFYLFNQQIGAGLYIINDQSGTGGLTYNKIYGSLAYEKDISNNIIGVGFQTGYVSGSVNDWGTWDNTTGTFTAPSGEVYFAEKASFIDLNIGFSWKRKINHLLPKVGINMLHLNKPNISFLEGEEKKNIQILFDTRLDFELNDKLILTPLMLLKTQQGISQSVTGADIAYAIIGRRSPVKSVFGGIHLQNGILENASSILLQLGTRVKRIDIIIGYERNLGDFGKTAGMTGAFEFAIVYNSISTLLNTYSIPCERY